MKTLETRNDISRAIGLLGVIFWAIWFRGDVWEYLCLPIVVVTETTFHFASLLKLLFILPIWVIGGGIIVGLVFLLICGVCSGILELINYLFSDRPRA